MLLKEPRFKQAAVRTIHPLSPPETKTLPPELIMGFSACFFDWSAKTISASRTNPCNDCLRRGASAALRVCVCVCVCVYVCLSAHSATRTNYLHTVHLLTNLFSNSLIKLCSPLLCPVQLEVQYTWNLRLDFFLQNSAVKRLNRIQNKSFCLHNICLCVLCVFIMRPIYKYTHIQYIFRKYLHVYIYIHIIYIIYKYI